MNIHIATEQDQTEIHRLTANSGVFSQEEVDCVDELWGDYRRDGPERSGYYFIVARGDGAVAGYACYGPRPLTEGVYDLYWLAVDAQFRGQGIGLALIRQVEQDVAAQGGRLIVVETSGTPTYAAARGIYAKAGYLLEATLKDFYHAGDDLVIFTKHM
jgi:ribosomal protein S18 acetylase RimI-like enzyme